MRVNSPQLFTSWRKIELIKASWTKTKPTSKHNSLPINSGPHMVCTFTFIGALTPVCFYSCTWLMYCAGAWRWCNISQKPNFRASWHRVVPFITISGSKHSTQDIWMCCRERKARAHIIVPAIFYGQYAHRHECSHANTPRQTATHIFFIVFSVVSLVTKQDLIHCGRRMRIQWWSQLADCFDYILLMNSQNDVVELCLGELFT